MKFVKTAVKALLWTAAVLAVLVLALPLWIGPVACCAANFAVPKVTKTGFRLGAFGLNPYSGRLHVGDMQLQNPPRFFEEREDAGKPLSEVSGDGILSTAAAHIGNAAAHVGDAVAAVGDALVSFETNAVSLKALDVKFSTLSALSDTVKIDEIVLDGLYFYGDLTFSNIREIADNASGGDSEKKDADDTEKKGGKKVEIGRVLVTGAKIQWGHVAVPLPKLSDPGLFPEGCGDAQRGFKPGQAPSRSVL